MNHDHTTLTHALPGAVADFLALRRIAVAGVSRNTSQPANAIFRRLSDTGHDVVPINPRAALIEGVRCYPSIAEAPGPVEGLVIAAPPAAAPALVQQAADHDVRAVWFHRSFGEGSVSDEAVRACEARGLSCIVGGCPLMFCGRVDIFHRCMRWWLQRSGRVPR
jgi:hypothetical protein